MGHLGQGCKSGRSEYPPGSKAKKGQEQGGHRRSVQDQGSRGQSGTAFMPVQSSARLGGPCLLLLMTTKNGSDALVHISASRKSENKTDYYAARPPIPCPSGGPGSSTCYPAAESEALELAWTSDSRLHSLLPSTTCELQAPGKQSPQLSPNCYMLGLAQCLAHIHYRNE